MLPYRYSRLEARVTHVIASGHSDRRTDFDSHSFAAPARGPHRYRHRSSNPALDRCGRRWIANPPALGWTCAFGTDASWQLQGTILSHQDVREEGQKEKRLDEGSNCGSETEEERKR